MLSFYLLIIHQTIAEVRVANGIGLMSRYNQSWPPFTSTHVIEYNHEQVDLYVLVYSGIFIDSKFILNIQYSVVQHNYDEEWSIYFILCGKIIIQTNLVMKIMILEVDKNYSLHEHCTTFNNIS